MYIGLIQDSVFILIQLLFAAVAATVAPYGIIQRGIVFLFERFSLAGNMIGEAYLYVDMTLLSS